MGFLDILFAVVDTVSSLSKFQNCPGEVYDEIITGHYSTVKDKVADKVSGYINSSSQKIKIGITNRPCERFKEHNYDNSNGYGSQKDTDIVWSKMVVVYESSTVDSTRKMESFLIDYFSSDVANSIGGGGGGIGFGKQYVYVLVK
jgi:hypothetical protein